MGVSRPASFLFVRCKKDKGCRNNWDGQIELKRHLFCNGGGWAGRGSYGVCLAQKIYHPQPDTSKNAKNAADSSTNGVRPSR